MKKIIFLLAAIVISQAATSGVCDHRPSKYLGGKLTGTVAAGSSAIAVVGGGMKVAGVYALVNGTTGATMLASTAAGASAAGTTGIIAGTAGAIGTAGSVLLSPFVFGAAAVAAVVVGTYEGSCYIAGKM